MKNSHGSLSILDGKSTLKAFCHKHCPPDWTRENDVVQATLNTMKYYKRAMRGRIWADSQASALAMAATARHAADEEQDNEGTGSRSSVGHGGDKKAVFELPPGAPVIPSIVYEQVVTQMQRFPIRKRREWVADVCKYWTFKRLERKGASLIKRLQQQSETFSSMELTRRNFAAMGPVGRSRLERRIEFAKTLVEDLARLKTLAESKVESTKLKLEMAEVEAQMVDILYFPIAQLLPPILARAIT
jgi:NuA3 HAT complex component NTO1